jgi:1-acyl-sn-glycerol-3-phosphate acyltransferase
VEKLVVVQWFPEGTRQPYGKLGEYQKGGISIAKNTSCEILPVYHNAGRAWPKGGFIL